MIHTGLILGSLALAVLGNLACRRLLRRGGAPDGRRLLQLLGLALPVAMAGVLALLLAHFFTQVCFWGAPPADVLLTQALTGAGALLGAAALLLNGVRAVLLPWHLRRGTWPAPAWLQAEVAAGATTVGLTLPPRLRVAADPHPWALVAGAAHPQIIMSQGLLALLDSEERMAVLLHELWHIRRADLWWTLMGGLLCDLTWFVPGSRRLYAGLRAELELACDDRVRPARQRLALASALARVWQAQRGVTPLPRHALALLSPTPTGAYEQRIHRLLAQPTEAVPATRPLWGILVALGVGIGLAQLTLTQVAMAAMGCGLHQWFGGGMP